MCKSASLLQFADRNPRELGKCMTAKQMINLSYLCFVKALLFPITINSKWLFKKKAEEVQPNVQATHLFYSRNILRTVQVLGGTEEHWRAYRKFLHIRIVHLLTEKLKHLSLKWEKIYAYTLTVVFMGCPCAHAQQLWHQRVTQKWPLCSHCW